MPAARNLISADCPDVQTWVCPLVEHLGDEDKAKFNRRMASVIAYAEGVPFATIRDRHGWSDDEVRRLVKRCCERDSLGNLRGFFALIPYSRGKEYERTAPTDAPAERKSGTNTQRDGVEKQEFGRGNGPHNNDLQQIGFSGSLEQVLRRFPDVRQYIHEELERPSSKRNKAKVAFSRIHGDVLKILRPRLSSNEWPFNTDLLGYKAFVKYFKEHIRDNPRETDESRHGKRTAVHRSYDPSKDRLLPAFRLLQGLQLDYNMVDHADVFIINLPNSTQLTIPVKRWWWGALVCSSSGGVVGVHIALERSPSEETAIAIASSVMRGIRLDADAWQLQFTEDKKVLINGYFPELLGHGMAYVKVDWGWANKGTDLLSTFRNVFGCAINFGTVASPIQRDMVEGTFNRASNIGSKATDYSYGSGPQDDARFEPVKAAKKDQATVEHSAALLYGVVEKLNTSPFHGNDGLSPVEAIGQALTNPRSGVFPMRVPKDPRFPEWMVSAKRFTCVVRNGRRTKRPAYVEACGCVYHHPELSSSDRYVGKRLIVYVNTENANDAFAVLEDGSKLFGLLKPEEHWAVRPHPLHVRRAINKLYRKRKAHDRIGHDPVVMYAQAIAAQARAESAKNSDKTSDAALTLARLKVNTGISIVPAHLWNGDVGQAAPKPKRQSNGGEAEVLTAQQGEKRARVKIDTRGNEARDVEFREEFDSYDISRFAHFRSRGSRR